MTSICVKNLEMDSICLSKEENLFILEYAAPFFYEKLLFSSKKDLVKKLVESNLFDSALWNNNIESFLKT